MPQELPSSAERARAMRAARRTLPRMIRLLTRRLSPFVSAAKRSRRKGVTSLPRMPRLSSSLRLMRSARSWRSGSSCSSCGSGLATTSPEFSRPRVGRPRITRRLSLALHAPVERASGVGEVETGEAERAESHDGHTEGLQVHEGRGNIEDGLDSGAEHGNGRPRERREVCRDVPALAGLPVHAAEAAGCEEAYPRERGEMSGGGDGRCPVAVFGDGHGKVPGGELRDAFRCGHELQLRLVEPDLRPPANEAYRRGHGAFGANGAFRLASDLKVLRVRQAVRDQGRFERHDGRSSLQGLPNVGPDLEAQAADFMQRSSLLRGLLTKRLTG